MKKPLNKELNPKLLFSFIAMINGLVTLGVSVYLGIESTIIVGLIIFLMDHYIKMPLEVITHLTPCT